MKYINRNTGKGYYGGSITVTHNGKFFSGVPTEEQLLEWGYEEVVETPYVPTEDDIKRNRMVEIQAELQSLDYLTSKEDDGEDMTKYDEKYGGDWHAYRRGLRAEFNQLEASLEPEDDEGDSLETFIESLE